MKFKSYTELNNENKILTKIFYFYFQLKCDMAFNEYSHYLLWKISFLKGTIK